MNDVNDVKEIRRDFFQCLFFNFAFLAGEAFSFEVDFVKLYLKMLVFCPEHKKVRDYFSEQMGSYREEMCAEAKILKEMLVSVAGMKKFPINSVDGFNDILRQLDEMYERRYHSYDSIFASYDIYASENAFNEYNYLIPKRNDGLDAEKMENFVKKIGSIKYESNR